MEKKFLAGLAMTAMTAAVTMPSVVHAEPATAAAAAEAAATAIVADWAKGRIDENAKAADREKTVVDKVIRTTTGVSVKDIKKHGPAGGKNSEVRKAGRAVAKVLGW